MSQFDFDIAYIKGNNNTVVDALSHLSPTNLEQAPVYHEVWANTPVNMVLSVTTDTAVLMAIQQGYESNPFCQKLIESETTGVKKVNSL